MNRAYFVSILETLRVGQVVSISLTGTEKFLNGTYTVSGRRIGRGRGGVLYVALTASNGAEWELAPKHCESIESIVIGIGATPAQIAAVATSVGAGSSIPATA